MYSKVFSVKLLYEKNCLSRLTKNNQFNVLYSHYLPVVVSLIIIYSFTIKFIFGKHLCP